MPQRLCHARYPLRALLRYTNFNRLIHKERHLVEGRNYNNVMF